MKPDIVYLNLDKLEQALINMDAVQARTVALLLIAENRALRKEAKRPKGIGLIATGKSGQNVSWTDSKDWGK